MKGDGDNQSSSSDNSLSSSGLNPSNHSVCYMHNTSEVICIKCLKKQVLDKRININVVNGMINETKNILNEILSSSLFLDDESLQREIDDEYIEEIKILRSQAIMLKKNKEQRTNHDLKDQLNKLLRENDQKKQKIVNMCKSKDIEKTSADSFFIEHQDTGKKKSFNFYKQNLKTLEMKLLQELVYFIDLRKNKQNNYYYICSGKLPLPRYISKIVRITDNSSLYNKRLYLLIEHLLNFFETGYKIYYTDEKDYDFLKMALNAAFSGEMENLGKDKIFIVVIKKLTLMLTLLQMIYIGRHRGQVTELLVDIKDVDYLAKLIKIALIVKKVSDTNEGETLLMKHTSSPYDIISFYKEQLLSLL